MMSARASDEGWPSTARVSSCPRCGGLVHTLLIRCPNCETNFKFFGVVQHEQYTFGDENPLRPPELHPKRMPKRPPSSSPAPAKASLGAKAPAVVGNVDNDDDVVQMLLSLDDETRRDLQRQVNVLASLTQFTSTDVSSYRAALWQKLREGVKQYRRWNRRWSKPANNFQMMASGDWPRAGTARSTTNMGCSSHGSPGRTIIILTGQCTRQLALGRTTRMRQ